MKYRCRVRRRVAPDPPPVFPDEGELSDIHTALPCLIWAERAEIRSDEGDRYQITDYAAVVPAVGLRGDDLIDRVVNRRGDDLGYPEMRIVGSGERWLGWVRLRLVSA